MSKIALSGDASGTGTFTIASPNSNTNRTLTLPDNTGTIITSGSTTGIDASALSTGTVAAARLPAGSVLQVVSTTKSDVFTTGSSSYVDVTGLAATITPTSASNKILVIVNLSYSASGNRDAAFQTVRGATVIPTGVVGSLLNGASSGAFINAMLSFAQSYLDSPATTSSTTYKVQVAINADTLFVNRRALDTNFTGQSTITLMEIAG